jgi:hypothetical protein
MYTITKNPTGTEMRNYSAVAQTFVAPKESILQRYDRFIEGLKFSHFGIMAMVILIGSCLGSITAMVLFYNGAPMWVFGIGLFATLANLVASISQAPTKWMFNTFIVSVLINLVLIALFPLV